MMTFVVVGDMVLNAQYLSTSHLGKQRVEAFQILNVLEGKSKGWSTHLATLAWVGYIDGLKFYINCMINEWIRRGHTNTMQVYELPETVDLPWWTQWGRLHETHKAMLLRKNPGHYSKYFTMNPEYQFHGYIWPTTIKTQEMLYYPLGDIAAPVPQALINPVYCKCKLKSGQRMGAECGILVKDGHPSGMCGKHAPREKKPKAKKTVVPTPTGI